jgi:hypothetical protein
MANSVILAWNLPPGHKLNIIGTTTLSADKLAEATTLVRKVPLLEDIALEVASEFKPLSSILPSVANEGMNLLGLAAAASGTALSISNYFDIMLWSKTRPLTFDFEVLFYPKTSALTDVLIPTLLLMGLTSLTEINKGEGNVYYETPGISLSTAKDFLGKDAGKALDVKTNTSEGKPSPNASKGKTLSIKIPGVITLPSAIVTTVRPTFSKELTDDGCPLWSKVSLFVQSVLPVTDTMLQIEAVRRNTSIESQIASFIG